jgi:hypothetical protein
VDSARVLGFRFGGGAQGALGLRENPATTMFNQQINREIEAQRYEADKKMNLYKLHMNRLGDESQAALQTGINLRQIADQQFNEMMGKTGLGPMAMQNFASSKSSKSISNSTSSASISKHEISKCNAQTNSSFNDGRCGGRKDLCRPGGIKFQDLCPSIIKKMFIKKLKGQKTPEEWGVQF